MVNQLKKKKKLKSKNKNYNKNFKKKQNNIIMKTQNA